MPNDDKIYEAYQGKKGKDLQELTKERIDWILLESGNKGTILDVGCSQGIISLLLGKKHHKVDAIDIQKESILFAKDLQEKEFSDSIEKVHFFLCDFLEYTPVYDYSCIVMTEILEHIENPQEFLYHAKELLKANGTAIISVPFSLNRHPDHKKTYYVSDFYNLVAPVFYIEKLEFIGQWMCMVARKKECSDQSINRVAEKFLLEEERQFLKIDTALQEKNTALYESVRLANEKVKRSEENYSTCKTWLAQKNEQLQAQRTEQERLKERLKEVQEKSSQQLKDIKERHGQQLEDAKGKIETYQKNYETCKERLATRTKEYEKSQIRVQEKEKQINQLKDAQERLNQQMAAAKSKIEAYQKNYETCKEWLATRTRECEENRAVVREKEEQLVRLGEELNQLKKARLDQNLAICISENDKSVQLLIDAKKEIQRLQAQNSYLKAENVNYARKFARITSTWYGSFALMCYHKLQKSKWRLQAIVRKIKGN